jgi:hypothetical protein
LKAIWAHGSAVTDPRVRWLLGTQPRARWVGAALLALAAVLALAHGNAPADPTLLALLLLAPPTMGLAYAAWNGGPLLAVLVTQVPGMALAAQRAIGPGFVDPPYALLALPAGLAAFALGAWRAHRALGGPPPLGEGRAGRGVLALWGIAVIVLGMASAWTPSDQLGPPVWGLPWWAPWVRMLALWGPPGAALGWAAVRRGPVVAFALATLNAWAYYLALGLGATARAPPVHLLELVLPVPLDAVRGVALLGIGLVAVVEAMAFEPAWPWMDYRKAPEAAR